jgi:hypothetical protein
MFKYFNTITDRITIEISQEYFKNKANNTLTIYYLRKYPEILYI